MTPLARRELAAWLAAAGTACPDVPAFVAGFGQRLGRAGVPLARLMLHLPSLDAGRCARAVGWAPGAPASVHDLETDPADPALVMDAGLRAAFQAGDAMHADAEDPLLRADPGLREVVRIGLALPAGRRAVLTLATRAAGGFTAPNRALLAGTRAPAAKALAALLRRQTGRPTGGQTGPGRVGDAA